MILVAAGDSFVWGSELGKRPYEGPEGCPNNAFPALLAKQNNMGYVCAAYPGAANNAISRLAIAELVKISTEKFLFVQWTTSQRGEFVIDDEWVSINCQHTKATNFSKQYFKYINSEYYEVYSVLKEIVFLQNYCQVNQIPFMFTTADNYFFEHDLYYRRRDADIDNLYNQIDWSQWYMFFTDKDSIPKGFYQWAIENKYSTGRGGHPLDAAHQDAAELIKGKFNELVKKYYQSNRS